MRALFPALLVVGLLSGCHGPSVLSNDASAAQQHEAADEQRQELDLIPPPSKTRYLAVHSLESWENPYLTVQANMVTVHVLRADANPTSYGVGGIMRPLNARRQDLSVTLDKLGDAITAIPHNAWPYGRVIAVEEAHKVPASGMPQVRRTMESTMKTLNDLGVVVDEWTENGPK